MATILTEEHIHRLARRHRAMNKRVARRRRSKKKSKPAAREPRAVIRMNHYEGPLAAELQVAADACHEKRYDDSERILRELLAVKYNLPHIPIQALGLGRDGLTVRMLNALRNLAPVAYVTVADVDGKSRSDLLRLKNFGGVSVRQLRDCFVALDYFPHPSWNPSE